MKRIKTIIFLLLTFPVMSYSQCRYDFLGFKMNQNKILSINVGSLQPNGRYSGMQMTMPVLGSPVFLANAEVGRGFGTGKRGESSHLGLVGYGILGLYVPDFGIGESTWQLNYGVGVQTFYKQVSIGLNYTTRERIGVKLSWYFSSAKCN